MGRICLLSQSRTLKYLRMCGRLAAESMLDFWSPDPTRPQYWRTKPTARAPSQTVSGSMLCFPKWISNFYLPLCHVYWSNIPWAIKCQQNCPRPHRRYKYEEDKIPAHKQLTSGREMITCLQLRINRRKSEQEQRKRAKKGAGKFHWKSWGHKC